MTKKSTDTLKQVLGSLSPEDIAELNAVTVRRTYPADFVVCREGEMEDKFYVIESGLVSVTRRMNDNAEQVLGILRDGQFFGEMGLLEDVPRSATVTTMTECGLIEISEETFDALVNRNPAVAVTIMRGISHSLRDTSRMSIAEMELKNQELARALKELKEAQAELLQQERLKRDLEIASEVQRSILPSDFTDVENLKFGVRARSAREVGGDFYDVIELDEHHVVIVVADVSGKSWQAAIFMAVVRALLLREAEERMSPAQTMQKLHRQILKTSRAEMFVTIFYAVVDIRTRHMRYVRAGHERPILYRANTKTLQLLNPPGQFVGLWPQIIVEEAEMIMRPGDCLVCYSDGVTDAENIQGDKFGLDRLLAIVSAQGHLPADDLAQYILESVDGFTGSAPQADDISIFVVKAT